jgi:hypothetical protein
VELSLTAVILGLSVFGQTPAPRAQTTDENDPMAFHDPGVYVLLSNHTLVQLERAGSDRAHTSNVIGHELSYGLSKSHVKAEIPGSRATLRVSSKPEFYMYFPNSGGFGAADSISSPKQFILELLDGKKDRREVSIMSIGFASASGGADEKTVVRFEAAKIHPYAYNLIFDGSLKTGEYAFIASSGVGGTSGSVSAVMFDFGVD